MAHFSTAYLPPIAYVKAVLAYPEICLEHFESWQKQSYRNRCYILGANGVQFLNIPVAQQASKTPINQVCISYHENWQRKHWQALVSAYGNSPFFEVLAPDLEPLYLQKTERLLDWNTQLFNLILKWLQYPLNIKASTEWEPTVENDFRNYFSPKKVTEETFVPYPQVFQPTGHFSPNLSVIDLIFNEGPAAFDYLHP